MTLFGRQLSAVADLGTIALLYFIVKRFYKARVALLAAAFSALTVMQIQQSHFYTTDNFSTFFMFLTLSVAAVIATGEWKLRGVQTGPEFGKASVGSHFLAIPLAPFSGSAYLFNDCFWDRPGHGGRLQAECGCHGGGASDCAGGPIF